jgi:hypothetical protein
MRPLTNTHTDVEVPDPCDDPAYVWRRARDRAFVAYQWWSRAPVKHRRAAYAVYVAAEEQEAAAAEHLRLMVADAA